MAGFGDGLGAVIGGALAHEDLAQGIGRVGDAASGFGSSVQPFRDFGASFLPMAYNKAELISNRSGDVKGYDDFMKDYQASPGAQYVIGQAQEAQNNSAAAKGKLLSGGNMRGLTALTEGLSSTFANQAYDQYLKGDNQQFQQLEQSLGDMFKAIGVGTTVTGQEAGVVTGKMGADAQLAKAQADADKGKGSGIGSMFSGLASFATMF